MADTKPAQTPKGVPAEEIPTSERGRGEAVLQPGQLVGQKPGIRQSGTPHISDISGAITTKNNQVFMLTASTGDIIAGDNGQGLYFRDMRYLDQMEMLLGDQHAISLLADASLGSQSIFELTNPHMLLPNGYELPKERLSIRRTYDLRSEITQTIEITNLDRVEVSFRLSLLFDTHFDDMLVIRSFLAGPGKRGTLYGPQFTADTITLAYDGADQHHRSTRIQCVPKPTEIQGATAYYDVALQPGAAVSITITLDLEDRGPNYDFEVGIVHTQKTAAEQHSAFDTVLSQVPAIETSNALFDRVLARSFNDLKMLATASHADVYLAAGIPWYVALFGRD
ncbi:MAG TPA: glycogen debranching N-terminal domain-containing protein, partial [Ktedonobacterales bacterium]|nr:glycogen debranching N-terminal domain-containing protein [Ktedonobacterales bacterium]